MSTIPAPASPASTDSLMTLLRESTTDAHRHAETRPFNRALAQATLPRAAWISHLEQFRLLHQALDERLGTAVAGRPAWAALIEGRSRQPELEADLDFWGGDRAAAPLPATVAGINRIATTTDDESLGMLYVLEGSTNGGRFLVRSATRAFGLAGGVLDGIRFLDPYGDEQPARWTSFKTGMNALTPAPEPDQVRLGALAMFDLVSRIADEVWNP